MRRWISQHRPEWQKATVTLGMLADGRWYVRSARHCWNIWQPYETQLEAAAVAERLAYGMHEEPVYQPVRLHKRTPC